MEKSEGEVYPRVEVILPPSLPARLPLVITPINLRACANELPPLDYVLPGMLAGTVGAIISAGGTGKSMLALEIAIALTTGHDLLGLWQNQTVKEGPVLYLPAEDPELPIEHRVHSLLAHLPPSVREKMFERLTIQPMIGRGCDLMSPKWQKTIEAGANEYRLIILDTLNRYHTLEENNATEMSQLLRVLEKIANKTRASFVYLHHSSKNASLANLGSVQQASRGSSVLVDNSRWQCNLAGMTEKEADQHGIDQKNRGNFVRVTFPKLNYGPPIPGIWLKRVKGGVLTVTTIEFNKNKKRGYRATV